MKNFKMIFIFIFNLFFAFLNSDSLKINNLSNSSVFAATYYQKGNKANIVGKLKEIKQNKTEKFERPKRKFLWDRVLIISKRKEDLNKNLSGKKLIDLSKQKIGFLQGRTFYIVSKGGALKIYKAGIYERRPLTKKIKKPIKDIFDQARNVIANSSHYNDIARVRLGDDLCKEEKQYLNKRKPIVKKALENFLNIKLNDYVPNIAVCASGGGYRAMIATLGLFLGLEKIGLLDGITYMAGLSGSTWFMAPWTYYGTDVASYGSQLQKKVEKDLKKTGVNTREFARVLATKYLFKQPVTLVDTYGALLANNFFGDLPKNKRFKVKLSDLQNNIEKANKIFPILTSVEPGPPFSWFEFTPYEVGRIFSDNFFVPTWAFGRKFLNGKSKDFAPEQMMGYFMGIWGSAFALALKRVIDEAHEKLPTKLENYIRRGIELTGKEEFRMSPAKLFNSVYGMNLNTGNSRKITLVDAGFDFNLPFPPLLRQKRNIDIIIVCDASKNVSQSAPAIKKAKVWALKKEIKFPDTKKVKGTENIKVLKDNKDPNTPLIIYFPLSKNKKYDKNFDPAKESISGFCQTFKLKYKKEDFELLSGLMKYNVEENEKNIKEEIKNYISQRVISK
ncbi:hypothetical protein GF385_00255 [Candidatus Dependentiae bacterium]|nr:hypothetical protein [Candidatus Dependentiae bacterium]